MKSRAAIKAMAQELISKGLNVELVENAVPRMYYNNQIRQHIKGSEGGADFIYQDNPDQCDYVLRVKDAYYDIGFLKHKDGHYVPVFDDYDYKSWEVAGSKLGKCGIKGILGAAFEGKVGYWSGRQSDNDQTLHSVGKMLQSYTKHASIEAAVGAGYTVAGIEEDAQTGEIHIRVSI